MMIFSAMAQLRRGVFAIFTVLTLFFVVVFGGFTQNAENSAATGPSLTSAPQINARSAVLIDATTGTLLYAKNPDLALPPASLAKLMTLHIAYEEISAGRLSLDELVEIDGRDCSPAIPYGSSIMYLHPGMQVSVRDLMLGAAVVSGNDAAYSLARRISGSNNAFAERMNEEAKQMGFDGLIFTEPSGLSEFSLVSARQFALFCKKYIELHPQALKELHSVKSIEFPRAEHTAPRFVPEGRIIQYNRNPLISSYEGADGLKTGYIIEVGFNMAATALRDGSRFIAVSLGGTGSSYAGGGLQRTKDTTKLLDWAFTNFKTVSLDPGTLPSPRTWFGKARRVDLIPLEANAAVVPQNQVQALQVRIEAPRSLSAPIEKGQVIGKLIYSVAGKDVRSISLGAAFDVPKGTLPRRIIDGIGRFFAKLFGKA